MLNNCASNVFCGSILPMLNNEQLCYVFCSSIYLFLIVLVVIFTVDLILGNPLD